MRRSWWIRRSRFIAGDQVEVLSEPELLATLDDNGEVDGLPLMPEMLQAAGKTFHVASRADKTCWKNELRSMSETVHLQGLRCDGSAHGGCQAGCLFFFKEEWLRKPGDTRRAAGPGPATFDTLQAVAGPRVTADGTYYSCQATSLGVASHPLVWWSPVHFLEDIRDRNASATSILRYLLPFFFNKMQTWSVAHLPPRARIRSGAWFPFLGGTLDRTPKAVLGLTPGERVRVRSRQDIAATLSKSGHNRGLSFDVEMLEYCGQEVSVRNRVERTIDEHTGRMEDIRSDCLILDNVVCSGKYNGFCTRKTYPFWREIWLDPAPDRVRDDEGVDGRDGVLTADA